MPEYEQIQNDDHNDDLNGDDDERPTTTNLDQYKGSPLVTSIHTWAHY